MAALVQSMTQKRKVAIARLLKGKVGQARLVALLPQTRVTEEASGATVLPCGFHVVELPFADDIRSVAKPAALAEDEFEPDQLDAARGLVRALTLPPGRSPVARVANPASATH